MTATGAGAVPAAMILLAALGACSSAAPSFVPHPEQGVELRWPNGDSTVAEARNAADQVCARKGQQAVLAGEFMDRDETLARFDCR